MDPLWEFSRPIEFFGKVVDELGSPVAGLRVEFSWKDLSSEGTSSTHSATDAFGRFSLTDVSGKVVTIRLDDSDYNVLWKTNQFAFEYANPFLPSFHTPNPDQPVIFHVLKKRESAPLISRRVKVRFSKNGEPTRVNLLTGMESSDGELEVRAWVQERDVRGRYDWKVSLRMTQGGFLETSEEFPSEAPSSGYDTAMEFSASASSPEWRPSLEKQFYFVVGSPPRFGRMKFSAKIYASGYYVDYFINPTGDRNLVYDPLRDVDLP